MSNFMEPRRLKSMLDALLAIMIGDSRAHRWNLGGYPLGQQAATKCYYLTTAAFIKA
jgi:hypothetical protein